MIVSKMRKTMVVSVDIWVDHCSLIWKHVLVLFVLFAFVQ